MKGSKGPKLERKTMEKNRRMHMKSICFKLYSLVPKDSSSSKGSVTQQDRLDEAVTYVKDLKESIERLKKRKERMCTGTDQASTSGPKLPAVDVRQINSSVAVVLVTTGLTNNWFLLPEVIGILDEEGAEVVSASFSTAGDSTSFYTIHSKAISARIGVDTESVYERLTKLVLHR